ncbi:hypothetical protein GPJ56_008084 [Histomonas meleagridis]|uniref:uncharacterized protein n=1 Tax=Histomonas meleagridis TaxID=135588 RepID=UPI00355A14DB|nr:hypothetical protein GPJ56_008084 [Histomonas meleagridis]KAH0798965.1 hypothetical protein GO595_008255 [Histomonas meleagridis]
MKTTYLDRFLDLYTTSLSMIIVGVIAVLLLVFDNDPPLLPLHPQFPTVDCNHIELVKLSSEGSRINVSLRVNNFTQFPKTSALKLLRIFNLVGSSLSEYHSEQFWDVISDTENISFCILSQMGGKVRSSVVCQQRVLGEINHTINDVNVFPVGWSRSLKSNNTSIADLRDFCYSNNTIIYFSQPIAIFAPFLAAQNDTIQIQVDKSSREVFASTHLDFTKQHVPTLFITANNKEPWRQIIDVLLPIYHFMRSTNSIPQLYLTRNQNHLLQSIGRITQSPILLNDTKGCFDEGHFIRSTGSIPLDLNVSSHNTTESKSFGSQYQWLFSLKPDLIHHFRSLFTSNTKVSNIIVVDRYKKYANIIEQLYPGYSVVKIPKTENVAEIAELMSSAKVFISSHLSTMVYGLFLSKDATLVEMQPIGRECTNHGKKIAEKVGCGYHAMMKKSCRCRSLECYFRRVPTYNEVSEKDFSFLKKILNK